MTKQTIPQKLPQGGGSFARKPDGSLSQVEKPTADPVHKPVHNSGKPATPTAKAGSNKEIK
ncbi:hypothetical protein [Parasedimentitalea psychrophila]|uniref:Uncharacterized protein n=1 Tax=Parasedimentitalea psychrophila TaxID=2997337 RepID=A0A9Y2KXQ0_9RHOB|nr:hypothetical protein [Parasedimentitalea psychrophila]WIY25061.1 hypothetical protein QPJ95_21650 [Parasedimentitalea psychrophila]